MANYGGHIVQGHVDGVGTVVSVSPSENWTVVRIALPDDLCVMLWKRIDHRRRCLADGVGGGVWRRGHRRLVRDLADPTTLAETNLGITEPGLVVNLEVDVIAKYVERLHSRAGGATHNHGE